MCSQIPATEIHPERVDSSSRSVSLLYYIFPPTPNVSFFASGFPTKTVHAFLFSLMCATCPAHVISMD
jgi:hypothetical protein